jgi:hypothetical protein
MAGGSYRGILAAVPPAQRLRSASGKGAADLKPKQQPSKIKRSSERGPSRRQLQSVRIPPVGASLLAMNLKATHFSRQCAFSFTSIASRLAPTIDRRTTFDFHHPQWIGVPLLILTTHQAER